MSGRDLGGLDLFRPVAAALVIAIHTSPLEGFDGDLDFFLTRIIARLAVPFFFMVTGQFVLGGSLSEEEKVLDKVMGYVRKNLVLYIIATLLYLPLGIYAGYYSELSFASALRLFLFDGGFYHLWYFPALITGILVIVGLSRLLSERGLLIACLLLYIIGLFGDSYYGFIMSTPLVSQIYELFFCIFSYTRNGIFMAPVFLLMGALAARKRNCSRSLCIIGFALSLSLMTVEGFTLKLMEVQRHDSMYIFLLPSAFFLYRFLTMREIPAVKGLRRLSAHVYLLHPAVIVLVRGIAKALGVTGVLVDNTLVHFLAVCVVSFAGAWVLVAAARKIKGRFAAGKE